MNRGARSGLAGKAAQTVSVAAGEERVAVYSNRGVKLGTNVSCFQRRSAPGKGALA
jgi:hypothetical protein